MPFLDKATVREEPHELGTSILGRVADRTTSPAPAVEQTDDGTLDDDGQRDGSEFAMEDNLNDVNQDREVEAHAELSGGVRRTTRASSHASHGVSEDASSPAQEAVPAPDTQPLDTDAGADEIASDGNVDPYYEAQVSNTAGDVLERDLLPIVSGPNYIPYPYAEDLGCESPPYTKYDWDEIHGVNLGLQRKELYKDPKVCRTALDRFPTPAEAYRLRKLSSVELSDRMSVLQCQLVTHGSVLNARFDHSLKNVERLTKRLTAELEVLKSKCQTVEHKLTSWDKKHKKYRNERDTLSTEKAKIEEELVGTKSQLEHRERQAEEIQGNIASFFQSDFTPLVQRFLKSCEFNRTFKVAGFILDAKEKFDRVITAFPNTTFPFLDMVSQHSQSSLQDIARLEPDRVTSSHQPSFATASLMANTHVRHSTSSSGTFGHTSTPEHLKKKKKSVTPPKYGMQRNGNNGVLLQSPYAQVTQNDLKRDVL
ncbi:hypothetical protein Tco_0976751 [Tanacetum coccineum]|uniref:Uncharacterized protein n=1 Tax=Tanacetum coccineum TaxID=301880 RepID=A0ABQ5EIA4_9ASTR